MPRTSTRPERQKRQPNFTGERILLRANVTPEVAENVKALARARNVCVAMILSEALTARFWGSRI